MRLQLLGRQQENSASAALELEPYKRELAERPPHRRLGIPHLDDQQALRPQILTRLLQNDPDGIQTRASRGERDPRLMTILGRQLFQLAGPHVGRVRHDDIVALFFERAEMIRLHQPQAPAYAVTSHVDLRDLEGVIRDVDSVDSGAGKDFSTRNRNAARAGPDVEDPSHAPRLDPRSELAFDEFRYRRPRNEDTRVHLKGQPGKRGLAGEINGGHSFLYAARDEVLHPLLRLRADALRINRHSGPMR